MGVHRLASRAVRDVAAAQRHDGCVHIHLLRDGGQPGGESLLHSEVLCTYHAHAESAVAPLGQEVAAVLHG